MLVRKWLKSGRNSDRQKCIVQRRLVTGAVKRAKNEWLQDGKDGRSWDVMREIQKGWAGL